MAFKTKAQVNFYATKWRLANKEKWLAYRRKNRAKHKQRYQNKDRELNWKRRGIIFTTEQYDLMLQSQQGVCAICSKPEVYSNFRLAVDHDHKTGRVRGLLCALCNAVILRTVEHHSDLLDRAKNYLLGEKYVSIA